MGLPVVVVSSVIRSTQQGESHGGVYLIDLETGRHHQCVDWDDQTIDWAGRGADRGLRGVAIHGSEVLLAASDEILVYDQSFQLQRSYRNPYLAHCHEISLEGDLLHVTSTGFDAVLTIDLETGEFVRGHHLAWSRLGRLRQRRLRHRGARPIPRSSTFDPREDGGPAASDTCHVNNVHAADGRLYLSGTGLGHVLEVVQDGLRSAARIPYGTHNARPFREGVLYNHTAKDAIVRQRGNHPRATATYPIPQHEPSDLRYADLPGDHARPSFGRGLCVVGDGVLVGGSSPATVTAYDIETGDVLRSVTLTRDVRNAIHGLDVWPFDMPPSDTP